MENPLWHGEVSILKAFYELPAESRPAVHHAQGRPRTQPATNGDGPHMQGHALAVYERLMTMPDAVVTDKMSVTEPPVKVG